MIGGAMTLGTMCLFQQQALIADYLSPIKSVLKNCFVRHFDIIVFKNA